MDSTPDRIRIIPELLGAFNIAAQQNRISFIRGVKIQNPTDTPLSTVVLSIRAEPEFMREFNLTIDYIPAEREFSCGVISPDIDYNLLSGLTERVDATLYFELAGWSPARERKRNIAAARLRRMAGQCGDARAALRVRHAESPEAVSDKSAGRPSCF